MSIGAVGGAVGGEAVSEASVGRGAAGGVSDGQPVGELDRHWEHLLTVALLGTDRRDPPTPPEGPVADVVADAVCAEPSARMLADVAACAAVRRAAFVPGPPADRLAPPEPDTRPLCPHLAVRTWRYLAAEWPVLEDEWVLTVVQRGWRLPADVTVALLTTHRRDAARRALVVRAAGPVASWLLDHVPDLRPTSTRRRTSGGDIDAGIDADPDSLALPELAMPPDLMALLAADAHTFVRSLLPRFHDGSVGAADRPVLVNLIARCRHQVLVDVVDALDAVDHRSPSSGIAHVLADLATTRARMLTHLTTPASGSE